MSWIRWLGGLVVTLAGLKAYGELAARRARATYPPVGRFVTVDGLRLHYLERGTGQPVVLLHASGLVLQDFTLSIFDRVAAACRAIAVDRPGYGYSERPADRPLTLDLNVQLLRAALTQLGVTRPILVGHSTGGSIALRYALDYPEAVAGLVLLAPGAYAEDLGIPSFFSIPDTPVLGPLFLHMLLAPTARVVNPLFVAGMFAPATPPAGYVEMLGAFNLQRSQFRAHADELNAYAAGLREQSPRYGEIRVPVVIMAGAADRVDRPEVQSEPLHRAIPQSHLTVLPETGHALHHQHPAAVLEAIEKVQRETSRVGEHDA
jgi:pimeloyl-ACP methyl ester carboxylesterase